MEGTVGDPAGARPSGVTTRHLWVAGVVSGHTADAIRRAAEAVAGPTRW